MNKLGTHKGIANIIFIGQINQGLFETEVVSKIFSEINHINYDYYDSSFSLYLELESDYNKELTDIELIQFKECGFKKFWICYGTVDNPIKYKFYNLEGKNEEAKTQTNG